MIVRDKDIPVTGETISGAIAEFLRDVRPRLDRLGRAYEGKGAITQRMRSPGLPNNRLVHAFPRYIVSMASGYLVGKPVTYDDSGQSDAVEALREAYAACDMDSVDAELAADASIYGRGVCICYADAGGRPKAATLSPKTAFVVYDDTVEHRPLFGVHWIDHYDGAGRRCDVSVHAFTADEELTFTGRSPCALTQEGAARAHYFGGVPVVEFWNNAQETGDFEPVLSLIDAYDTLESDRVNDKQQFTDAVLLLTGCTLENDDPEDRRSPAQRLLEEKTLSLPDTDASAQWLVKQSDEAGAEVLRQALREDIHKMSLVPDLTDESFAANASGVAMRYKLLGLEQLTATKERWFREGLRSRMRLFARFLAVLARANLNPETVQMTFTRALPVNETEVAQMVAQLSTIAPRRALLAQLPFIDDVDGAMAELDAQQEKEIGRRSGARPDETENPGA